MKKIIDSKYGILIFSLLSGVGYFLLAMGLISKVSYSYLLGIFFFPAIICGAALCLVKAFKAWREQEEYVKIKRLVLVHIGLLIFSVIFFTVTYMSL